MRMLTAAATVPGPDRSMPRSSRTPLRAPSAATVSAELECPIPQHDLHRLLVAEQPFSGAQRRLAHYCGQPDSGEVLGQQRVAGKDIQALAAGQPCCDYVVLETPSAKDLHRAHRDAAPSGKVESRRMPLDDHAADPEAPQANRHPKANRSAADYQDLDFLPRAHRPTLFGGDENRGSSQAVNSDNIRSRTVFGPDWS